MLRQMTFCRIFNNPDTLILACPLLSISDADRKIHDRKSEGKSVFRGAYMMTPHGGDKRGDAITYWLKVVDAVSGLDIGDCGHLSEIACSLITVSGIGAFLANQICTDMRYVPEVGERYSDWETFVLCGPGTRRGLNRYNDRPVKAGGSDQVFASELLLARAELSKEVSREVRAYFKDPNNLANSFCEFDKYERAVAQAEAGEEITLRHYKQKGLTCS